MKPTIVFPDAMLATLEVLRLRVPVIAPGVTFGTYTPSPSADGGPTLPYVRVRLDAAYGRFATQTATVRLNVWDATEAKTLVLAQVCRAVLLAFEGNAKVRSFGSLTGPIPTTDPDSGAPVAYLTVAARLRPETLE